MVTFARSGLGLLAAAALALSVPVSTSAQTGWLPLVNAYRASAGLPAVTEDPSQSAGDLAHAHYMLHNNVGGHTEDPSKPGFSATGATAAQQSNVLTTSRLDTSDEEAIGMWMVSPFHAIGIVDPNLATTGYGSAHEAKGGVQTAAALNVIAGRAKSPRVPGVVTWPGDGASVPLTTYPGNEAPDPLTACAGYTAPTGLPIILETGAAAAVTATSISDGAAVVASCEFDGSNYVNPVAADQANGRAILAARGAVILVPRAPLSPGTRYTVAETVNSTTYRWTFGAGVPGLPSASSTPSSQPLAQVAAPPRVAPRPAAVPPAPLPTPTALSIPPSPAPVAAIEAVSQPRGELTPGPRSIPAQAHHGPPPGIRWPWWGAIAVALLLLVAAIGLGVTHIAARARRARA